MMARRVLRRAVAGALAPALILLAAAQPMLLCAGARSAASTPTSSAHASHHAADAKAPAHQGHHHFADCCSLCASACGHGTLAGTSAAALLAAGQFERAQAATRATLAPRAAPPHHHPFSIGPPASPAV